MSRGITENDVWQAADALLLEGARPTIERVRQKIGRGSPNTVSPHLDTWFKHLGGRIKDPGAFSAPPEVPDPVMQVARHLWEVAQADARQDLDQRLQVAMAAAIANVEAEKERAAIAEAATFEAAARATRLQGELEAAGNAVEQERIARARVETELAEARLQLSRHLDQISGLTAEISAVRAEQQRLVEAADDRAAGAERRAALEIESARQGQVRAERRADAAERKLDVAQTDLRTSAANVAELGTKLEFSAQQHVAAVQSLKSDLAQTQAEAVGLRKLLAIGEISLKAAEAESAMARTLFDRFSAGSAADTKAKAARTGSKRLKG